MCRELISVDWQGSVYDCDFNQMLGLPLLIDVGSWDFELSYNINFPKGLPSESDLSTNGYLSLSVGYFTGL